MFESKCVSTLPKKVGEYIHIVVTHKIKNAKIMAETGVITPINIFLFFLTLFS